MKNIDLSNSAGKLLSGKITAEIILGVLFIIYLVAGYSTPPPLSQMAQSNGGVFVLVVLFLSLFLFCNPIVAILGLFVVFELIRRSNPSSSLQIRPSMDPNHGASTVPPSFNNNRILSENKKNAFFTASNQFPPTLEEEVVKTMTVQQPAAASQLDPYQPILENIYDAAGV